MRIYHSSADGDFLEVGPGEWARTSGEVGMPVYAGCWRYYLDWDRPRRIVIAEVGRTSIEGRVYKLPHWSAFVLRVQWTRRGVVLHFYVGSQEVVVPQRNWGSMLRRDPIGWVVDLFATDRWRGAGTYVREGNEWLVEEIW